MFSVHFPFFFHPFVRSFTLLLVLNDDMPLEIGIFIWIYFFAILFISPYYLSIRFDDARIIIPHVHAFFTFSSIVFQVMDDRWESEVIEYGAVNITGFRVIDTKRKYVRDFLDGWRKLDSLSTTGAGRDSISVSYFLHHFLLL